MSSNNFIRYMRRSACPVTLIITGLFCLTYLLAWLTKSAAMFLNLAYLGGLSKPWTLLTYPFASMGSGSAFICLALLVWWFWWAGGEVEHAMHSLRFLIFFAACTVVGSVAMLIAGTISHSLFAPLYGDLIPVGAVTVAWGFANPRSCINLMAVIPIQGFWLAWLMVGIVLFEMGSVNPLSGIVALIPLGLAAAVAYNRIGFFPYSGRLAEKQSQKSFENVKQRAFEDQVRNRKQERLEKERLRKLLEDSMKDE